MTTANDASNDASKETSNDASPAKDAKPTQVREEVDANSPAPAPAPPTQSAQQIVNTYIRALKEYNDTKDVAQQLIGLVAENRGVTVSKIYEDEEYGVTSKD